MDLTESLYAARSHADRFTDDPDQQDQLCVDEYFCALALLSDHADTYATGPTPSGDVPAYSEDTARHVRAARDALDQALRARAATVLDAGREVATDGGTDEEPVALHVGDHVRDRDSDDDRTMIVTGLPLQRAATYEIDADGTTVADVNDAYDEAAHVIEVAYPSRTDAFLCEQPTYGFPRPRLELVAPVHDRDDGGEEGRP